MESLKFDKKNKKIDLVVSPIPKIDNDEEVVVKVTMAGVCGTDIHILHVSTDFNRIFCRASVQMVPKMTRNLTE